MEKKYVFKEYDLKYPALFKNEKKSLESFLKNTKIEHIGSTAMPTLGGKGIIDLMVGVKRERIDEIKELLQKNDYEFKESGGDANKLFFKKPNSKCGWIHIQLIEINSEEWVTTLAFRDYLIKSPLALREYEKVKKEAVLASGEDGKKYRDFKESTINRINKMASKAYEKLY